ncbi:MAG: hypothetical protein IPN43_19295 [Chitinophagaceae bacterium]|nr:hypothetical protein [Chitinophagaceae bacterium]
MAGGTTTARVGLRNANNGEEFSNIPGQCRLTAIIKGNTVTISGIYGLIQIDDFGYTRSAKENKRIIYYNGSKGWELFKTVAKKIGVK